MLSLASAPRLQTDEELLGKIKSDLKEAMRAKDSFKSTVLRVSQNQLKHLSGSHNVDIVSLIGRHIRSSVCFESWWE